MSSFADVYFSNKMAVIESEELSYFVTYATIVLLKLVVTSLIVIYFRATRQVVVNPEDLSVLSGAKEKRPVLDDPDVERARRCHLNDVENILPFFGLGLLYALYSGAAVTTVAWHFRVFAASRVLFTIAYLGAIPPPGRGIWFFIGVLVNISMAVQLLMNNMNL